MDVYSTYEAKSRFSELIRKVKAGRRIVVTHHGVRVAEIRPIAAEPQSLVSRLEELEREGIVQRPATPTLSGRAVARRRGALSRFLASRD